MVKSENNRDESDMWTVATGETIDVYSGVIH